MIISDEPPNWLTTYVHLETAPIKQFRINARLLQQWVNRLKKELILFLRFQYKIDYEMVKFKKTICYFQLSRNNG